MALGCSLVGVAGEDPSRLCPVRRASLSAVVRKSRNVMSTSTSPAFSFARFQSVCRALSLNGVPRRVGKTYSEILRPGNFAAASRTARTAGVISYARLIPVLLDSTTISSPLTFAQQQSRTSVLRMDVTSESSHIRRRAGEAAAMICVRSSPDRTRLRGCSVFRSAPSQGL